MLGGLGDEDFAAADVQEGDQEEFPDTAEREHLVRKKVALPEGGRVHLQKLVPRLLAAMRSRIEAVLAHDVSHELPGDFLPRELAEFAQDARVTPAGILAGQLDDQFADVDAPAPSSLAWLRAGLRLANPAE